MKVKQGLRGASLLKGVLRIWIRCFEGSDPVPVFILVGPGSRYSPAWEKHFIEFNRLRLSYRNPPSQPAKDSSIYRSYIALKIVTDLKHTNDQKIGLFCIEQSKFCNVPVIETSRRYLFVKTNKFNHDRVKLTDIVWDGGCQNQ